MTMQVMVKLPDDVYQKAEGLAQRTGRNIADVLTSMLEVSLPSIPDFSTKPLNDLSDEEVLFLADSRMDSSQNVRLSTLLQKQQETELDEIERHELSLLMYIYHEGSLRKARATVEAVQRGLRQSFKK